MDTSALVAIALNEPEATAYEHSMADDPAGLSLAATMLEIALTGEPLFHTGNAFSQTDIRTA